jgi:hypothetical protein
LCSNNKRSDELKVYKFFYELEKEEKLSYSVILTQKHKQMEKDEGGIV